MYLKITCDEKKMEDSLGNGASGRKLENPGRGRTEVVEGG